MWCWLLRKEDLDAGPSAPDVRRSYNFNPSVTPSSLWCSTISSVGHPGAALCLRCPIPAKLLLCSCGLFRFIFKSWKCTSLVAFRKTIVGFSGFSAKPRSSLKKKSGNSDLWNTISNKLVFISWSLMNRRWYDNYFKFSKKSLFYALDFIFCLINVITRRGWIFSFLYCM